MQPTQALASQPAVQICPKTRSLLSIAEPDTEVAIQQLNNKV